MCTLDRYFSQDRFFRDIVEGSNGFPKENGITIYNIFGLEMQIQGLYKK